MRLATYLLAISLFSALLLIGYQKYRQTYNQPIASTPSVQEPPPTETENKEESREQLIEAFRAHSLKEIPLPQSPNTSEDVKNQILEAQKKFKAGDFKDFPDPNGQVSRGQKTFEAAMSNEASAKELLTRMQNCITHLNNQVGMPEAMRIQMQAFCVQNAESITKRYPALKEQFEREVQKKASPATVEYQKQMANGG